MQRAPFSIDEYVPVADAVFARVLRARPQEAAEIASSLGEADRAKLALFCNARAHLREAGLAIAAGCSDAVLIREGGYAGQFLAEQARSRSAGGTTSEKKTIRSISLSGRA